MTRKEARGFLDNLGIENEFSLRKINMMGDTIQELTVKNWTPSPKADVLRHALRDRKAETGETVIAGFSGTGFVCA